MRIIETYRTQTRVFGKIWKADNRYLFHPEPPTTDLVKDYLGCKAVAKIPGLNVEFRTAITQWNRGIVVLTLPAALNPTWERLWRKNERLVVELTIEITKEGENIGDEP